MFFECDYITIIPAKNWNSADPCNNTPYHVLAMYFHTPVLMFLQDEQEPWYIITPNKLDRNVVILFLHLEICLKHGNALKTRLWKNMQVDGKKPFKSWIWCDLPIYNGCRCDVRFFEWDDEAFLWSRGHSASLPHVLITLNKRVAPWHAVTSLLLIKTVLRAQTEDNSDGRGYAMVAWLRVIMNWNEIYSQLCSSIAIASITDYVLRIYLS